MKYITQKTQTKLDVFITLHKKDIPVLKFCIYSILQYLQPKANRIVIISDDIPHNILAEYKSVEFLHESNVFNCFTLAQMPKIIHGSENRTGWYFQQFLKWEARKYSTTDDYVVVDADTVFIEPIILIQDSKYVFYRSDKYYSPYLKTYEKLFGYLPEKQMSYIADFMTFNTRILDEIITKIEKINSPKKWYEIILDAIDKKELSSFSEFETYGYYMCKYHPNLFDSKKYRNKILQKEKIPYHTFNKIINKLRGYVSISYHCYDR